MILLVSILFDIVWYWMVIANWSGEQDIFWEKQKTLYWFGIFIVFFSILLKVGVILRSLELSLD
mgnify:CR=1 FL=1